MSELKSKKSSLAVNRMPAEWVKHEATWLAWPHNVETWPDIPHMENFYADMIAELSRGEKVKLLVNDEQTEEKVRKVLSKKKIDSSKVIFYQIATTDAWIRDYGPNFVLSPEGISVNRFIFNAWGSKYEEHQLDNIAARQIVSSLKMPVIETEMILEGGSIDANGLGTMLTTEECLLNTNRNSSLERSKIESSLKSFLGVTQMIWLGAGIKGDDTDGHIDDIARFVNPTTVVCVVENNSKDENYAILQENVKRLSRATDQDGKKLIVIELPMPKSVFSQAGDRLPASYANFYIGNQVVLMPIFDDPNDKIVLKIFKDLFPERSIIGMNSKILVHGLGGIHCITHEEPAI